MGRLYFIAGAISGFLAVVLGVLGAHALKQRLVPEMLAVFETGVRYQMYHAFALFVCSWAATQWPSAYTRAAGNLFIIGIVIFSGSLYALSLSGIRWLGAIAPLGGLAFLAGWLCLILSRRG